MTFYFTIYINKEIYKRDRQASIHLKLDDLAIVINDSIKRHRIAKGLVFVQEDLNRNILDVEKITLSILFSNNKEEQVKYLIKIKNIIYFDKDLIRFRWVS